MRRLHKMVQREISVGYLHSTERAYVWNDSVLLLAYVGRNKQRYERALRDADNLKRKIDAVGQSYAIAVKGMAFPPAAENEVPQDSKFVYIESSSYAMANCFVIEEHFKKKKKRGQFSWYIDDRIVKEVSAPSSASPREEIRLFPKRKGLVHCYDGYLWDSDSATVRAECTELAGRDSR